MANIEIKTISSKKAASELERMMLAFIDLAEEFLQDGKSRPDKEM